MREDVEDVIYSQNGSTRSVEDQIAISHQLREGDIGPNHEGLKANEFEDELDLDLDYAVRTSLGHLEDADLIEEFVPPGPSTLVIATWMDDGEGEVVNGNVQEAATEGVEALADDVRSDPSPDSGAAVTDGSGVTRQRALASEFDLVPDKVTEFLLSTDRPVEVLNDAVAALEEVEGIDLGDDYGEIAFINMPYRYRLTPEAVQLYNQ